MAAKYLASPANVQCQKSKKALIFFGFGAPFLGPSFSKKGSPKIAEGGPFDPHWPISRINPEGRF